MLLAVVIFILFGIFPNVYLPTIYELERKCILLAINFKII